VRAGHSERVSRLVANSVYLVLAPFMGAKTATELVEAKLREASAGRVHLGDPVRRS
jgi:hypothetical protein